jgi:hypothetical protein
MEDLRIRKVMDDEAEFQNELNKLRTQIDVIDHQCFLHEQRDLSQRTAPWQQTCGKRKSTPLRAGSSWLQS